MKDALFVNTSAPTAPPPAALTPEQSDAMNLIRGEGRVLYPESVLRMSITMIAAFTVSQYSGRAVFMVWMGLHTAGNIGFLIWLARQKAPFGLGAYRIALLSSMVLKLWFAVASVYMLTLHDPVLTITAIAAGAGLALHVLLVSSRVRPLAIFSALLIAGLVGATAGITMTRTDTVSGIFLLIFCFVSVSAYFAFALYDVYTSHRRMRHAEAQAVEAQRMQVIGQMTRGIARDFNNLLTGIQGNLELTRHLNDGAEREQTLDRARDAARRAADLTAQLVAYARQSPLRPEKQDMADLMPRIAARLRADLPESHSLTLDPVARMQPVNLDAEQLSRALKALVANAVAASPQGGKITLRARLIGFSAPVTEFNKTDLGPGTYCAISVLDGGPGIAPHLLPHVTEPFFTTSQSRRNSGLGLPMSLGFAEQSGGALGIASQPGRTEVTIYLPCPDCGEARSA